ncbi:glycosyltransferase, partial [Escherichia coli]|nr:glycosyltransferase [Escherichia coli]
NKTAIFCLPSIHASSGDAEGFGLVLLEAAACGVPVITSAFGGAEEGVIHGLTGFSFPEKDTNRLSYYLNLLLSDPNLMES